MFPHRPRAYYLLPEILVINNNEINSHVLDPTRETQRRYTIDLREVSYITARGNVATRDSVRRRRRQWRLRVPSRDLVPPPGEFHFRAEILETDDRLRDQREYRQEAAAAAALRLLVALHCSRGRGSRGGRRGGSRRRRRRVRVRRRQRVACDVNVIGIPLVALRVTLLLRRAAASVTSSLLFLLDAALLGYVAVFAGIRFACEWRLKRRFAIHLGP